MTPAKLFFFLTLLSICAAFAFSCGGGDDENDDEGSSSDDDDADDDDDNSDDDDDDDDDDDNDDDDDDNDNDDDDTSVDTEYGYLGCEIDDPAGLGEGRMFGGGEAGSFITVYVFDNKTCEPLENAMVIVGHDDEVIFTDEDGKAIVNLTGDSVPMISANKQYYWGWSYDLNYSVMYFRLQPNYGAGGYSESGLGQFQSEAAPLELTNPTTILEALSQPIYAGIVLSNISRTNILDLDPYGLITSSTFNFDIYIEALGGIPLGLPSNIYMPNLDITVDVPVVGEFSITGVNEQYRFPYSSTATDIAYEGFVMSADLGEIVSLSTIFDIITAIAQGGGVEEILVPLIEPLLDGAVKFPYIGHNPDWDSVSADLGTTYLDPDAGNLAFTISNPDSDFDYLQILAAEVPNRSLMPMGIAMPDSGTADHPVAHVPDADYIATALKTDIFSSDFSSARLSAASKYAENLEDWEGEVTIDDSEFLPFFKESSTFFNATTGEVHWLLDEGTRADDVDLYLVLYLPTCQNCPDAVMAVLPADETWYQPPITSMGIDPYSGDGMIVIAMNMFDDVNEGFDPTRIIGYNNAAISVWSHYDLIEWLEGLFGF